MRGGARRGREWVSMVAESRAVGVRGLRFDVFDDWLQTSRSLDTTASGRMAARLVVLESAVDLVIDGRNLLDAIERIDVVGLLGALSALSLEGAAFELELHDGSTIAGRLDGSTAVIERAWATVRRHGEVDRDELRRTVDGVRVALAGRGALEPHGSAAARLSQLLGGGGSERDAGAGWSAPGRLAAAVSVGGARLAGLEHVFVSHRAVALPLGVTVQGFTSRGAVALTWVSGERVRLERSGRLAALSGRSRVVSASEASVAGVASVVCLNRHRGMRVSIDGGQLRMSRLEDAKLLVSQPIPIVTAQAAMVTASGAVVAVENTDGAITVHIVEPTGWLAASRSA